MTFQDLQADNERLDFLDAYLEGKTAPSVRADFEAEMAQNPDIQAELTAHYLLRQYIIADAAAERAKELYQDTAATTTVFSKADAPKMVLFGNRQRLWWAIAASLTLLIGGSLWFLSQRSPSVEAKTFVLRLIKTPSGAEQGAVPTQNDTIYLRYQSIQIVADARTRTPQYDFQNDTLLTLFLPKMTQPTQITTPSPFSNLFDITIEGTTYAIVRGKKGVMDVKK